MANNIGEIKARLENWCVTPLAIDPYTPPECQVCGFGGEVYGHPAFSDGDTITTSGIGSLRAEGDNLIATTSSGTEYLLGAVDPNYERAFPDARARVLKAYSSHRA